MATRLPLESARLSKIRPQRSPRTLADRAFEAIHDGILSGQLEAGQRLPIEDLAAVLDMSPMPIREAVRRLDAVGLVENVPHRGARVTQLSIGDLREVYEARLALEPLAVRHAAERLSDGSGAEATAAMTALTRAMRGPVAKVWPAHSEFHFSLYRAARSAWLLRLITPLWESSERYRLAARLKGKLDMRQAEHEAILDAVLSRDPDLAAALLYNHLARTANEVAAQMGDVDGEMFSGVKVPRAHPA